MTLTEVKASGECPICSPSILPQLLPQESIWEAPNIMILYRVRTEYAKQIDYGHDATHPNAPTPIQKRAGSSA